MTSATLKSVLLIATILALLQTSRCYDYDDSDNCDKKPLHTKTAPLPPDDRFVLEILNVDREYIPKASYIVRLRATDNDTYFIAFTISVEGGIAENVNNKRRPIPLHPGTLSSSRDSNDRSTTTVCTNTVIQTSVEPKQSVEALWIAPPKGNKCVTLFAFVAVKPDVWYSSDGPLSKVVCEDSRKQDDMKPPENSNCRACVEARYELVFEGLWSYNTHSLDHMFPVTQNVARFSDIVGASHNQDFILYRDGLEASPGLKMLAEQGNTTQLERHILQKLGTSVRTLIKATGPAEPSLSTVSSFRVTQEHHFMSIAAAILPSPDWFLGVYNMELCDNRTNTWAKHLVLNLFPMDAGTDSGQTFESSNEPKFPPAPISRLSLPSVPKENITRFARIVVNLIRTYPKPECLQTDDEPAEPKTDDGGGDDGDSVDNNVGYNPEPETSSPAVVVLDPESSPNCPVTEWDEWLPCEGSCVENKLEGYQSRFRYFIIDGVAVGKNFEEDEDKLKEVPEDCVSSVSLTEIQKCEDTCENATEEGPEAEPEPEAHQRPRPGQGWSSRK